MKTISLSTALALIVALVSIGQASEKTDTPEQIINRYIETLKNGDWTGAQECWLSSDMDASKRLGIEYTDSPAKYDCASALVKYIDRVRNGEVKLVIGEMEQGDDWVKIPVTISTFSDSTTSVYYTVSTPNGWRLTAADHALTKNWKKYQSKYADIYYTDNSRINSEACRSLDEFIDSAGTLLGLTPSDLDQLAQNRLDYYLCDESQIQEITGYDIHGMVDLPSDAIITQHLPHKHEMTHFLINYSLRKLLLYTTPFMQEGLACYLGGRWEKSPAILSYAGYAVLKYDLAALNDILAFDGFHYTIGSADISYPVSALFVRYLFGQMTIEEWKQLYLELSGDIQDIQSWSLDRIQSGLEQACGQSWEDISSSFAAFWPQFSTIGIKPGGDISGDTILTASENGNNLIVTQSNGSLHFIVTLASDKERGFVLFSNPSNEISKEYVSSIFHDQLPDWEYDGCQFGVRFTTDEIACYDYYNNELTANYIRSFSMDADNSAKSYWNDATRTFLFEISTSIMAPQAIAGDSCRLIGL